MPLSNKEKEFLLAMGMDNGTRTEFRVARLKLTGELARTDLLCAESIDDGVHPLYSMISAHPYQQLLSQQPTLVLPENHSENVAVYTDQNTYSGGSYIDFTRLDVVLPATISIGTGVHHAYSARGKTSYNASPAVFSLSQDDVLSFDSIAPDVNSDAVGMLHEGQNSNVMCYPEGYYKCPAVDSDVILNHIMKLVKFTDGDFDRTLPVVVKHGRNVTKIPHIEGRRRVYMVSAGSKNGNSFGFCVTAYATGVGDDIILGIVNNNNSGYDRGLNGYQETVPKPEGWTPSAVAGTNVFSTRGFYHLSGVPMFSERYIGSFEVSPTTEELVGNVNVFFTDITLDVGAVWGTISTEAYQAYLSTGHGIYTPLTGDKLQNVLNSWIKLAVSGVGYKINTISCGGRSFKETSFYREYGRMRAKACKDNNYMELPYNETYTFKQVENKLQGLTSRNVWVQPVGDLTAVENASYATVTVTIADLNSNQFTASSSDKGTKTFNKTEEGLSLFLDTFAGYYIDDSANVLSLVMGVDTDGTSLAQVSQEMQAGVQRSKYDIRIGRMNSGFALDYDERRALTTIDDQIGFLAAQVTDYQQFNGKIVTLNNQFKFSEVVDILISSVPATTE